MKRVAMAVAAVWAWTSSASAQPAADISPALNAQALNAAVFLPQPSAVRPVFALPAEGDIRPVSGTGLADRPSWTAPSWSAHDAFGAGATVDLWSPGGLRRRLEAMGFKDGDQAYARQARVYLFAAVHGQALGLNLQGLQRAGWSTDTSSALVGDGQIGVGWKKGAVEADVGYVHRSIHFIHSPVGLTDGWADDMAAVSFTFRPHW
ncbi:MAG: hypothetical protein JOZ27_04775 [Caulobacteraceae bacterium]|nr:hypothetical protein [Caulobacteraceae bacterium]